MLTWKIDGQNEDTLVASGAAVVERLEVAPVIPPSSWFTHTPSESGAYPIQFEADGRVHGYVSKWGITHIGFLNKDVYTPKSKTNYGKYRTGSVLLDDGSMVSTGRLTVNTVHPKLAGAAHNEVQAFYDESGCAVADVSVYEDEIGIYVAGAVRPSVTPEQLRVARGSDWSPDWRTFNGNFEMVALLAVNLSGFIIDGLVASGGVMEDIESDDIVVPGNSYCGIDVNGEFTCIIGNPFKAEESEVEMSLEDRVEYLESYIRRQELAEKMLKLNS